MWKERKLHPVRAWFNYRVRPFFRDLNNSPRDLYRKVKRGVQRAYRGWADEDVWSCDNYLSRVILGMLKRLKATKQGHPCVLEPPDCVVFGSNSPEENEYYRNCEKAWDNILDKMIYAFELNVQIANGDRESYNPTFDEKFRKEMDALTLKEDIERRRGMLYFLKHYESLWD
jgi:hypothetical protein